MSRSGIGLAPDVIPTFEDLKQNKALAWIVYGFSDDKSQIIVDKKVPKTGEGAETYEEFIQGLPLDQCRYIIYDFAFELSDGGKRDKIIFITWSPDDAPVRNKMLCASSKDSLRRRLDGIAKDIQGTDLAEIAYDVVLEKLAGKQTTQT